MYFVGEIESESIRSHQRTALVGIGTDDLSQRKVQNVGASVVSHDQFPPRFVDVELHFIADSKTAFQISDVDDVAAADLHVLHSELSFLHNN